jgi:hypothetical protein
MDSVCEGGKPFIDYLLTIWVVLNRLIRWKILFDLIRTLLKLLMLKKEASVGHKIALGQHKRAFCDHVLK